MTIYNGVDLDRFRPANDPDERAAIRQKFIVPASARVVAFVGNGFARKGLGFLIEAWPLVAGGSFLLVVGADRQTEKFARRARALNVRRASSVHGPANPTSRRSSTRRTRLRCRRCSSRSATS